MVDDDKLDPRVPLLNEINEVRSPRTPTVNSPSWTVSPYMEFLFQAYVVDPVTQFPFGIVGEIGKFGAFLDYLERLSTSHPSPKELNQAPLLEGWCAGQIDPTPRLFGRVTGHPGIGEEARVRTSPFLQINTDEGWARTWSRYYRLGESDPQFLDELIRDGVVPSGTKLIAL